MFAIQKKLKNEEYPNKNRYFEIAWKHGYDDVTLVMDNVTWVKMKILR